MITIINNMPLQHGIGKVSFCVYQELKKRHEKIRYVFLNSTTFSAEDEKGKRIKNFRILITPFKIINLLQFFLLVKYWLRSQKTLLHIFNQEISFLGNNNSFITCHDINRYIHAHNLPELLMEKFLHSGIKRARLIISVSHSTRSDLIYHYRIPSNKIKVIYSGVDNKLFRQNELDSLVINNIRLSKSDRNILQIGLGKNKNFYGVLESLKLLKTSNTFSNLKLLKVGPINFQEEKDILKQISNFNFENEVLITGSISERDLVKIYNLADVLVYPSFYEGFGLPPLEAMACGCPVIAGDIPSLREVCGDAACYVNPYNRNEIADTIKKVLTNKKLRQSMIAKGLRQSKKFSWYKTAEEMIKVYR